MVCIYCKLSTEVVNSRPQKRLNRVWRRRHCTHCGAVFSTIEDAERSTSLVVRSNGRFQPFVRDTLFVSIYESCKHRKTAVTDAGALTDTILSRLPEILTAGAVEKVHLAALTLEVLQKFDALASSHYAAFHVSR